MDGSVEGFFFLISPCETREIHQLSKLNWTAELVTANKLIKVKL